MWSDVTHYFWNVALYWCLYMTDGVMKPSKAWDAFSSMCAFKIYRFSKQQTQWHLVVCLAWSSHSPGPRPSTTTHCFTLRCNKSPRRTTMDWSEWVSIAAKRLNNLNYGCLLHIKACNTDDQYNPISSSVSKWLDTFLQSLTFDPLYVKCIEVIFRMLLGVCFKCL